MSESEKKFEPTIDVNTATVANMFEKILNDKLKEGVLEQAIEKSVKNMMEDAVESVFKSYGNLNKKMQSILTKAIEPKIDSIQDLPTYHEMVMQRVRTAAQSFHDNRLQTILDEELSLIMKELESEASLSYILDKVKQTVTEDESCEGRLTLHIEKSSSNYLHVAFDTEESEEVYRCKYRIQLKPFERKEGEEAQEGDDKRYVPFAVRIDDTDYSRRDSKGVCLGSHYGVEKLLFNIYAMQGTIMMDCGTEMEEYDTYYSSYD